MSFWNKNVKPLLMSILPSVVAILIGLLFGLLVMIFASPGDAPMGFYTVLTRGISKFSDVLYYATPIIMTGLSVGFAYRMGLFNIGASGQFTMGIFAALLVSFFLPLKSPASWIVACVAAIAAGAIWGSIPGFFKALLNINEVITSIMFNYIGMYVVDYLISNSSTMYFATKARTNYISAEAQLPALWSGTNLNVGIIIAVVLAVILFVVLFYTTFGYELRATGFNKDAAKYAGMSSKRNIIITMAIAGALAGLGGALCILAPYTVVGSSVTYEPINVIRNEGFNGIAVALLGCSHPIGIVFSAIFVSYIQRGGTGAVAYKPEIIDVVLAFIIYFSAFAMVVREIVSGKRKKKKSAPAPGAVIDAVPPGPNDTAMQDQTGTGLMPEAEERGEE